MDEGGVQCSSSTDSAGTGMSDRKKKAETERPWDNEREHEKPSTTDGAKRKATTRVRARRAKTVNFSKVWERVGKTEEVDVVGTLKMFGWWGDAATKAGHNPTTTKWIDRVKNGEEGHRFVRCGLVALGVKCKYNTS